MADTRACINIWLGTRRPRKGEAHLSVMLYLYDMFFAAPPFFEKNEYSEHGPFTLSPRTQGTRRLSTDCKAISQPPRALQARDERPGRFRRRPGPRPKRRRRAQRWRRRALTLAQRQRDQSLPVIGALWLARGHATRPRAHAWQRLSPRHAGCHARGHALEHPALVRTRPPHAGAGRLHAPAWDFCAGRIIGIAARSFSDFRRALLALMPNILPDQAVRRGPTQRPGRL